MKTDGLAASIGLLVLRLGAGGLLITGHGWGKLMHAAERAPTFADPSGLGPVVSYWLVVVAEVGCAAVVGGLPWHVSHAVGPFL